MNKEEQQEVLFCEGVKIIELEATYFPQGGAEMYVPTKTESTAFGDMVKDYVHICGYTESEAIRSAKNTVIYEHLN